MNPFRWLGERIRKRVERDVEPGNGHDEVIRRMQRRQDHQAEELARLQRLRRQLDVMRRDLDS